MERVLTPEAQADRDAFEEAYGAGNCSCHLGCAPCGSCTHPGNPRNQEEDEECWMERDSYFEGTTHDYFVKGTVMGMVVDGNFRRWATPEDDTPDTWTVYRIPRQLTYSHIIRDAVGDHFDRDTALETAERLALEDKTLALLRGD